MHFSHVLTHKALDDKGRTSHAQSPAGWYIREHYFLLRLFRIFLSPKNSIRTIAAAGGMAKPSAVLLCVCMLLGPLVETVVLVPMVSTPHVGPAPGLRAVWNDLTPLVASAMQRLRFFFVFI